MPSVNLFLMDTKKLIWIKVTNISFVESTDNAIIQYIKQLLETENRWPLTKSIF